VPAGGNKRKRPEGEAPKSGFLNERGDRGGLNWGAVYKCLSTKLVISEELDSKITAGGYTDREKSLLLMLCTAWREGWVTVEPEVAKDITEVRHFTMVYPLDFYKMMLPYYEGVGRAENTLSNQFQKFFKCSHALMGWYGQQVWTVSGPCHSAR